MDNSPHTTIHSQNFRILLHRTEQIERRKMAMAMAGTSITTLTRTPTIAGVHTHPLPRLSGLVGTSVPVSNARLTAIKTGSIRYSHLPIRATSSEDTSTTSSVQTEELFTDLKEKWDAVENKSQVLLYGGGAIVAVWVSSIIVGAINSVPLLPKIMELIGLGYTGWFVYRYLLFKSSRKELASDIEELKKKIAGTVE